MTGGLPAVAVRPWAGRQTCMADNNGHEDGLAAGTGREQRRLNEQERRIDDEAAELRVGIGIAVLG